VVAPAAILSRRDGPNLGHRRVGRESRVDEIIAYGPISPVRTPETTFKSTALAPVRTRRHVHDASGLRRMRVGIWS